MCARNSVDFYDRFADDYDTMTRFESRFETNREIIRKWIEHYSIKSAIDIGCGTGLYAILLAQMGVWSAGADPSVNMLKKARTNAQDAGVDVEWYPLSMQDLNRIDNRYDALFCVGNTLPHLLEARDLSLTLDNFRRLLHPGGRAVIQLLNYARVLDEKERIVSIQRLENREYVRFYDFLSPFLRFNILTIRWRDGACEYDLDSTDLYPYSRIEIADSLKKAGFVDVEVFGDMSFHPFSESSKDAVFVARPR